MPLPSVQVIPQNNMVLLGKRAAPAAPIIRPVSGNAPLIPFINSLPLSGSKPKTTQSSLESKVANAPKKIKNKPTFILGEKGKSNLMEDFLEQTAFFNYFFPFYRRKLDNNIAKDTRMRIQDMKMNP
jgi:hypothetical protein